MAFESSTAYLVPGDTNNATDVFVCNRQTKQTIRVSVRSGRGQANGGSFAPDVIPDGRVITFESFAANLTDVPTDRSKHTYVHDRLTGKISMVSDGKEGPSRPMSRLAGRR